MMIRKKKSSIDHPFKDDLVCRLAELKPFRFPEGRVSRIEKKMLSVYEKQHRSNTKKHSSLSTWVSTIWEPSLIILVFIFLGWDIFSIISYLLN